MKGAVILFGLAVAGTTAAVAREAVVSDPASASWAFNGEIRPRAVEAATLPGGQAIRLDVRRKGANPWDIQAIGDILSAIEPGDRITVGFYARAQSPDPGGSTITLPVRVQQRTAPFAGALDGTATLTGDWTFHCVTGPATAALAAGNAQAVLNLAGERHVIDLGPFLITRAAAADADAPSTLPCGQPPAPPA